jgi:3-isopropylmalate/(R)-2-methylmalate dehydratase small subunit
MASLNRTPTRISGKTVRNFETIESHAAVLDRDDIDTDQIIPARFLKTTERTGLGAHLFADWRYDGEGHPRGNFVLNSPDTAGARILIGGRNFGCGSSREHAVWALGDSGFSVVIAEGFADIFRKNSLRNGLLTIAVDPETHRSCIESASRGAVFRIDLENCRVAVGGTEFSFEVDPFARLCMLNGVDELEYILGHEEQIREFEQAAPKEQEPGGLRRGSFPLE